MDLVGERLLLLHEKDCLNPCMHAGDHSIKLSISYALSQSTKLCVYEERVLDIVQSTKDLPESLAETGVAPRSPRIAWHCQSGSMTAELSSSVAMSTGAAAVSMQWLALRMLLFSDKCLPACREGQHVAKGNCPADRKGALYC